MGTASKGLSGAPLQRGGCRDPVPDSGPWNAAPDWNEDSRCVVQLLLSDMLKEALSQHYECGPKRAVGSSWFTVLNMFGHDILLVS